MIEIPAHICFTESDEGGIILDLESDLFYSLDTMATDMWKLIVKHGDITKVCESMFSEYDSTYNEIQSMVQNYIDHLCECRLISIRVDGGER